MHGTVVVSEIRHSIGPTGWGQDRSWIHRNHRRRTAPPGISGLRWTNLRVYSPVVADLYAAEQVA